MSLLITYPMYVMAYIHMKIAGYYATEAELTKDSKLEFNYNNARFHVHNDKHYNYLMAISNLNQNLKYSRIYSLINKKK